MDYKEKIGTILNDKGLTDFKWIDPAEIIVAQWVRVKCMFGCGDYGSGTCPPNTPSVSDCATFFKEYHSGLLIRLNKFADKECYPGDWSAEMTGKLLSLERELFLSGHHKAFLLNQTCCSLCRDCPGTRQECRDKKRSRPSPESFAVDVYQTVRNAGFGIQVVKDSPAEISRFAIVLID